MNNYISNIYVYQYYICIKIYIYNIWVYIYVCIYVIMKTMCPPSYHHNGFVATHALGHTIYDYTMLVTINWRVFTLFAWLVEDSSVHWYQQCLTVHHVPKCISSHKAIQVITGRAHCFHDYIYTICHVASVRF